MPSDSTTIHWHGISQRGSQYYDGVPYVTQCPIGPGQTFRYQFRADVAGSFFYHSHSGLQKLDGLGGPLIIRDKPITYRGFNLPCDEYILYLQDWMHALAMTEFPGLERGPNPGRLPASYLINGKGVFAGTNKTLSTIASAVGTPDQPPVAEFSVKRGETYKLRVISGTCITCPVKFYIQHHSFYVINEDGGRQVDPVKADSMTLNSGERFDIILITNQPVDSYWIVLEGIGECTGANQLGILRYEGGPKLPSANSNIFAPGPIIFNPLNPTCDASEPNSICVSQLKATSPVPPELTMSKGNMRILVEFGFHLYSIRELYQSGTFKPYFYVTPDNSLRRSSVNNISYVAPSSPLISQYNDIPKDEFCKPECYTGEISDCICTYIVKIPLGAVVDIVLVDFVSYQVGLPSHPFHLHGYNFYVLEEGRFNTSISEGIRQLYRRLDNGEIRNIYAPMRDSISLPAGGYVIMRFVANNPGFWLMHCHFLFHLDTGMAFVFQVGKFSDLPPVPKGFPKCENFVPPIER